MKGIDRKFPARIVLNGSNQFQRHTSLFDGQTEEFLASYEVKGDGRQGAFIGFGRDDFFCVSTKMRGCMNG